MKKKTLKQLTIKDNFMFGAVMLDPENCKTFLEMVLGIPIERVEISIEHNIVYHPEFKGVRLDAYAKDENNTHYNVEMQAAADPNITKRARYYHSQIDMEMLLSGTSYSELPDTYVIFICDFDPFGQKKFCYTRKNSAIEAPEANMEDGSHTIFLSTKGENFTEVSDRMVKFLNFVKADLNECMEDFDDDFVKSLQSSMASIKKSREMGERYMRFEELLKQERSEGKEEGRAEGRAASVLELLEDIGDIPEELKDRIWNETDINKLRIWHKAAAKAETIEQFADQM